MQASRSTALVAAALVAANLGVALTPGDLALPARAALAVMVTVALGLLVVQVLRLLRRAAEAEAAASASERRLTGLIAANPILVLDGDARIADVTPAFAELLGVDAAAIAGRHVLDLVDARDRDTAGDGWVATLRRPGMHAPIEVRVRNVDGHIRHLEVIGNNLLHDPAVRGVVVTCRDVTDRHRAQRALARQAMHDALTGLPNRTLFHDRLADALARAARSGTRVGVLFCDLDRFKVLNDSLGHHTGDRLLVEAGERIRAAVRPIDTVARFGGDEFVVLCEDLPGPSGAVAVAERIIDQLDKPFAGATGDIHLSTSVGITIARPDDTPESLVRDADAAMYKAKGRGRNRWELFDEVLRTEALERHNVEQQLRRALDAGDLRLLYQPIIDVRSGAVRGAEALLRWRRPGAGLVTPETFLDVAEETGMIVPITRWALEQACAQVDGWRRLPCAEDVTVSVNLSPRDLLHPSIVADVAAVLARTGVDPSALCLEVTEKVAMGHDEGLLLNLRRLKDLGVRLAIDDFGTGYSSLAHLRRFPADELKIDRSFVAGLGEDPHDTAIVTATISLAHKLGTTVVAEGVESPSQLRQLEALRCELAQGYLFGMPGPPEDIGRAITGDTGLVPCAASTRVRA